MKQRRTKPRPMPGSSPPPRASSSRARPNPPDTPPSGSPQTEYQREKANATFGNRRSARGYHPNAAADEPPVANACYSSTTRHTSLFNSAAASLRHDREQPTNATSANADDMTEDEDVKNLRRPGSCYARSSGEKLDPHAGGPNLGRTRSTRENAKESPHTPKQRSASVPNVDETPPGSSTPRDATPASNPSVYGTAFPPYHPAGIPHGHFLKRAQSMYDCGSQLNEFERTQNALLDRIISSRRGPAVAGMAKVGQPQARAWPSCCGGLHQHHGYEQDYVPGGSYAYPVGPDMNRAQSPMHDPRFHFVCHGFAPSMVYFLRNADPTAHSFSSNANDDAFKHDMSSKTFAPTGSSDSMDTTFTNHAAEEGSNFTANGGNEFVGASAPKHKGSPSARPERMSPFKKSKAGLGAESMSRLFPQPQHAESQEPAEGHVAGPKMAAGFDANGWQSKMNQDFFKPQQAPASSKSPTRGRSGATKRTKPVRQTPIGGFTPAQNDGRFATVSDSEEPTNAGSPMDTDMDMDDALPPPVVKSSARNIPVEPNRPEWRPGNPNVPSGGSASSASNPSKPAPATAETAAQPQPFKGQIPHLGRKDDSNSGTSGPSQARLGSSKSNPIALGSEDTGDLRASFSDLRHTEPFRPVPASGLGSFSDLEINLPFESRASASVSLDKKPVLHVPPRPPPAPRAPSIPITLSALQNKSIPSPETRARVESEWKMFVGAFALYLHEWRVYTAHVLRFLSGVEDAMFATKLTGHGYGWLDVDRDDSNTKLYQMALNDVHNIKSAWQGAEMLHVQVINEVVMLRLRVRRFLTGPE